MATSEADVVLENDHRVRLLLASNEEHIPMDGTSSALEDAHDTTDHDVSPFLTYVVGTRVSVSTPGTAADSAECSRGIIAYCEGDRIIVLTDGFQLVKFHRDDGSMKRIEDEDENVLFDLSKTLVFAVIKGTHTSNMCREILRGFMKDRDTNRSLDAVAKASMPLAEHSNLEFGEVLGSGGYGCVFAVKDKTRDENVAVKMEINLGQPRPVTTIRPSGANSIYILKNASATGPLGSTFRACALCSF